MNSEVYTDWSDLKSLEGEWNTLLRDSRVDTIFLTWEWISAWIEVAGESVRPFVVVVRNEKGKLVGLAPFYLAGFRLLKTLHYRTLRICADYATGSEHIDWIVHRDGEEETHYAVADTLRKNRDQWDCIWMPYVRGWTGSHNLIIDACEKVGFRVHTRPVNYAYVSLPESMDSFEGSLSRNMREQLKRQQKKMLIRKNVIVKQCQDSRDLDLYLDALFDLNCRRWGKLGQIGTFKRKPAEALFYRRFCRTALERNWLRLFALTENSEFKGVQVGYAYNNVFYQMQEGFDPDYIAGVGNVLRSKVIESCIEDGLKGYDFLGEMTEHKMRWLASTNSGIHIFIGHPSWRNAIIFRQDIWPTGKYLTPSILASANTNTGRRQS